MLFDNYPHMSHIYKILAHVCDIVQQFYGNYRTLKVVFTQDDLPDFFSYYNEPHLKYNKPPKHKVK